MCAVQAMPKRTLTVRAVNYDSRHDVLRLHFEAAGRFVSYDEEKADGVVVSRAADDDLITGMSVFDYSVRDKDLLKEQYPFVPWADVRVDVGRGSYAKGQYYEECFA